MKHKWPKTTEDAYTFLTHAMLHCVEYERIFPTQADEDAAQLLLECRKKLHPISQ